MFYAMQCGKDIQRIAKTSDFAFITYDQNEDIKFQEFLAWIEGDETTAELTAMSCISVPETSVKSRPSSLRKPGGSFTF